MFHMKHAFIKFRPNAKAVLWCFYQALIIRRHGKDIEMILKNHVVFSAQNVDRTSMLTAMRMHNLKSPCAFAN